MKMLITQAEVALIAFPAVGRDANISAISETAILAAQQKFLKPVLGELYDRLLDGAYWALLDLYIKPALAHYVRYLVLPVVSALAGTAGVVQVKSGNIVPASDATVAALRRRTRSDANALMRRAVEYIESKPASFPEYDPSKNILKRASVDSGILL